jgi:hypothetical protein
MNREWSTEAPGNPAPKTGFGVKEDSEIVRKDSGACVYSFARGALFTAGVPEDCQFSIAGGVVGRSD